MMKKTTLSLLLACLALLSLTACVDTTRQPRTRTSGLSGIYTVELWNDRWIYEFGEPVHLRATLTNVSAYTLTFGSESATTPVMDIQVRGWPTEAAPEEKLWSQENPDRVKYYIVLAPEESYIITWTLSPSFQAKYLVDVYWIDPSGHPPDSRLTPGEKSRMGTGIEYGVRPPGPLP